MTYDRLASACQNPRRRLGPRRSGSDRGRPGLGPQGTRTASLSHGRWVADDRLDTARPAVPRKTAGVPPRGFEPLISTLKGWRPRPLDDGGGRRRSLPEGPSAAAQHSIGRRAGPAISGSFRPPLAAWSGLANQRTEDRTGSGGFRMPGRSLVRLAYQRTEDWALRKAAADLTPYRRVRLRMIAAANEPAATRTQSPPRRA